MGNGRQVADQQRRHRQDTQHLLPVKGQRLQAFNQDTQDNGQGRQFRRATDHQRHGRGRTVVDVGHPHVEGHHAEFEGQASNHKHQAQDQHLRGAFERGITARNRLHHFAQLQ